jgi:NADH dehydrogenase
VLEANAVAEVRQDVVVFTDGAVRQSALTIWTAGFGVPGLAAASGLRVDALGRLLTDETLVSVDDDRIVAAGDAASPSGRPLRMSCQAAVPLGVQAANTVLSRIAGTTPAVIDQAFKGSVIRLGRHAATMQLAREDDTPLDTYIDGQKAAELKEEFCRRAVMGIGMEARSPGVVVWTKGGPRAARMVASL